MPTIRFAFRNEPNLSSPDALVLNGPTLRVQIGFDPNFRRGESSRPSLPPDPVSAIVDTGAADNYIDTTLAEERELPILEDRQTITGAVGSDEVNTYDAQIYIPDLEYTIAGSFAGVHLAGTDLPYRAIVGRSFLRAFTMVYDGRTGIVTLSND